MARTRMEWDWAGHYPITVYMNYVQRGVWHVRLIKGTKGDQNDPNFDRSPKATPWMKYTTRLTRDCQCISRSDVCRDAIKRAEAILYPHGRVPNIGDYRV